ncbi:hypothetical protein [Massilia sp. CF038]|uniref:hypothetical protein n=1 Tax=Massilia sp. CF038 TaxID=1881045 RepID=UPI00092221AF|nr:hypothetical protein [Massilia sp. CF038]SHG47969.1 hypothetical protein SAMN05428948_0658 [Massilia sp. CF038]
MNTQLGAPYFHVEPDVAAPQQAESALPVTEPLDRVSRLICARTYLYGLFGALICIHCMLGNPYKSSDGGVGYDRACIQFHALQSALLSLLFLGLFAVLYLMLPAPSPDGETPVSMLALLAGAAIGIKIAILNPILARIMFHAPEQGGYVLPVVGGWASTICDLLWENDEQANALYFAGERPFIGYGTEINSWSVVLDTSMPQQGIHLLAGIEETPAELSADSLYQSIARVAADMGVAHLAVKPMTFIEGRAKDLQQHIGVERFQRPPSSVALDQLAGMERHVPGAGRTYTALEMSLPASDILATQFVRFKAEGKLIFCEFATYVLAPGRSGLYRLERYFRWHWLAYLALPVALAVVLLYLIGLAGLAAFFGFFMQEPSLMPSPFDWHFLAQAALQLGLASGVFGGLVVLWRVLFRLITAAGIFLNITQQFGIAFSFRERYTSSGQLDYFSVQEVGRLLKTQEKVLIKAICEQLKAHHIDASDFKDNLTAYINQGVINSGDIRGNIVNSIKSFVFRRPAKTAVRKQKAKVGT